MTGAIAALAIGSDQVRGNDQAYNSLYFVGPHAVRHHVRAERVEGAIRPQVPEGVLMSTPAPPADIRAEVERSLRGRRTDVMSGVVRGGLLLALLIVAPRSDRPGDQSADRGVAGSPADAGWAS